MQMETIKSIMAELFRLRIDDIGANTTIKTIPAWDSLRHMELVVAIETKYGVELDMDEIVTMTSYPAIVDVLKRKGAI